jgi:serine/threonine-protein kinase
MDFIGRDELITAMHAWTLDKAQSLSEILVKTGVLDPADREVLEKLVARHIARHGDDPEKSLSSIELVVPAQTTLESINDQDIRESLKKLRGSRSDTEPESDSEATGSWGATFDEAAGRFHILSLHDEGGLGSVYLARDGEVNRDVALKRMKEEISADQQSRARFIFEAEITGNLEHPGIVPVYGKGEYADGRPYYAMRFIRGENLKSATDRFHEDPALKSDPSAREREFRSLVRRFLVVCQTMDYAHSRGIIHRDLKPRNIMLGPYGETLVVDWGLAKVVGHSDLQAGVDATLRPPSSSDIQATVAGSRVGTPGYMSPEQASGEVDRLGPATDIYSLGATLYYMLTKQSAFANLEVPEVLFRIERGEFPAPRLITPRVDRALEAICLRAMNTVASARYKSCRLLADDLECWLADQPVSVYAEPITRRVSRFSRRNKPLIASISALLFLGVAGLGLHDRRLAQEKGRVENALGLAREEHAIAAKERDNAAKHLGTTRKALRRQFLLAANNLAQFPKTEPLREQLARELCDSYKPLLETYPNDANLFFDAGEAHRILATSCRRTGKTDESLTLYQSALAMFESILEHPERRFPARRGFVNVLIDLGDLHQANGARAKAETDQRRAVEEVERLRDDPIPTYYFKFKATSLLALAALLRERGAFQEARQIGDQAVNLLAEPPQTPAPWWRDEQRWLHTLALHQRGLASKDLKDYAGARTDFERALVIAKAIPENSLYMIDTQYALATIKASQGEAEIEAGGEQKKARGLLDEAVPMFHGFVRDAPDMPHFRESLCVALLARCPLALASGAIAEAEKDSRDALALATELHKHAPEHPEYFSLCGRAMLLKSEIAARRGETALAASRRADGISRLKQAIERDSERHFDRKRLAELTGGPNQEARSTGANSADR